MKTQLKYENGKNYEYHDKNTKLGTLKKDCDPYLVTFISNNSGQSPVFMDLNGNTTDIAIGNVLTGMGILNTKNQRVELRSPEGMIFRLGENTIEGIRPVYSGKVYISSPSICTAEPSRGKYRTSCYCFATSVFIDGISNDEDAYYTLDFNALVYEYDEKGQKFSIFDQGPYTKTVLKYRKNMPMREKYEVIEQRILKDDEITNLINKFVNPVFWRI